MPIALMIECIISLKTFKLGIIMIETWAQLLTNHYFVKEILYKPPDKLGGFEIIEFLSKVFFLATYIHT